MDSPLQNQWFHLLPSPYYRTDLGAAYLGDASELIRRVPDASVNLILTSPPFALAREKEYGNKSSAEYVDWFLSFAADLKRILKADGSLILDLGGAYLPGAPVRSLYQFELLLRLCRENGFFLAQEFYHYNPARLPSPAEWVTVRRIRLKDAVNVVWWLAASQEPKADNRKVLRPYSESMKSLLKNGSTPRLRPSGHKITEKFGHDNDGAIPSNLLTLANTESNTSYLAACKARGIKPHPARFPKAFPEFFIKFLTEEGDLVLDPFAGSNTTGYVAEKLARRWICPWRKVGRVVFGCLKSRVRFVKKAKIRWFGRKLTQSFASAGCQEVSDGPKKGSAERVVVWGMDQCAEMDLRRLFGSSDDAVRPGWAVNGQDRFEPRRNPSGIDWESSGGCPDAV